MRIVALSIIIFASLYAFLPGKKEGVEIDDIKVKLSAPSRQEKSLVRPQPMVAPASGPVEETGQVEADEESSGEGSDSDIGATPSEDDQVTHVDESAESDQEKHWQDELSQVLVNLEPEFGEEIFNSYVNERNGFQGSLEELIRSNQKNQDLDELIGELESRHEEKVKEIFGRHYEEIKAHETKFLESESP